MSKIEKTSEPATGADLSYQQAQATAVEWERLARKDFSAFCEYVGRDEATERRIRLSELHRTLIRFVEYCREKDKYAAVQFPYEHGKSALFAVLYPLFRFGQNRNLTTKLVSASEAIVKVRVKQLRDHIDGKHGGAYNRVFPEVKADYKTGYSSFQIHVKREVSAFPTVWAHSVLATGEGGRCGLLILDDVVSRANALDKDLNEEVIRAVEGTWLKRLHPDGFCILLNTPWSTKDLMAHIAKSRVARWMIMKAAVNREMTGYNITIIGDE